MFLFNAPRVLTVRSAAIPVIAGQPALVPLKLEGEEGINRLFEYRLTLQTPDAFNFKASAGANFELDGFVGLELTCLIELEGQGSFVPGLPGGAGQANQDAGVRELSGLITSARFIGEDSRHALYELTLRPWLHLATLTTDCKVFQDQSPVQVIEAVLADYAFASDKRVIESYPQRDYTVQYNETDFEFITRLMQEWGINYHFVHSGGVHRLVWSDHNGAFQPAHRHSIPFYPLGHKIDREYIHGFSPVNRLTSGAYATREYDYTRPRATLDAGAAAPRSTGHADQQVYLWRGDKQGDGANAASGVGGSDYSQPNRGADKAANQTEGQGQHLARLRMQALRQPGARASGVGHVRGIVPGCTFGLTEHPQQKANAEYLTLHAHLVIENVSEDTQRKALGQGAALGAGLMATVTAALSDAQRLLGQWRVVVQFDVQPSTEVLRPEATQRKPKTGGPETALVVGPAGTTAESNIYTDALGRIKVQFPWDRYGQKNQNSSCWLRVSAEFAGNQLGAMHVPRIGQEVVVNFLGGDPDLPLASGRAYNQLNLPPWSLPEQQALSGFRSRELTPGGGNSATGRSNHLILDDTDQKIQVQLKSDHQHSSLSLGHITRIEDNAGRKDPRGQGFELRTDGHGVLRSKDGLLISTEARPRARAHAKDMGETHTRLTQAQDQHASLGDLAQQHQAQDAADQPQVGKDLHAQNDAIQGDTAQAGQFPEFAEPHITLASPAGLASTTPGSTHQHSGVHHAITSGGHTSISAAKSLLASAKEAVRLFAYKSGIKLISAKDNIDIQALKASVHLLAKLDITHTANRITLTAKDSVTINGGGSYTVWSAASIWSGTTGGHTVHAADFGHPGGKSVAVVIPGLPFVPVPDAYSVRLDASPVQRADYLPQNVADVGTLSAHSTQEELARMPVSGTAAQHFVFHKKATSVEALLTSGNSWLAEVNFEDVSTYAEE